MASDIHVIGPTKSAARLETDKAFSKSILLDAGIRTARSVCVESIEDLVSQLHSFKPPWVLKASGLAAGKGVWIGSCQEELLIKAKEFFQNHDVLLIEDFLVGFEASYFVYLDGCDWIDLGDAQDHKRRNDHHLGPNTGGMGAIAPAPLLTDEHRENVKTQVIAPLIAALSKHQLDYKGILFIGLMICDQQPYVLEFNCRLGDPETQSLVHLWQDSVLEHMLEMTPAKLIDHIAHGVVVAANTYPDSPDKKTKIGNLSVASNEPILFHGGTRIEGDSWYANGGRLFTVTSTGRSLSEATKKNYDWLNQSMLNKHFHYRLDIGQQSQESQ